MTSREARTADLPVDLRAWVEEAAEGSVLSAQPHFEGASRLAWRVDVLRDEVQISLFLLQDKGGGGGSARDAAVLRALTGSAVPVPRVIGFDAKAGRLLLARLPGDSTFPVGGEDARNEATAGHLMRVCADLHAIDLSTLALPHLDASLEGGVADASLEGIRAAVAVLDPGEASFFSFALDWLERNVPPDVPQPVLVHSDLGPGNFVHLDGRVTGLLDWEVAHAGDPMEDLAALAVRDMATPVGSLTKRFREYEEAGGERVDLRRIDYYRLLILVRNSAMIGLGLSDPPAGFDVVEMTMYQTLLLRAASLVLCDAIGNRRPTAAEAVGRVDLSEPPDGLTAAMQRDLHEVVLPALSDEEARRRAVAISSGLSTVWHERCVAEAMDERDRQDRVELLSERAGMEGADVLGAASLLRDQLRAGIAVEHVTRLGATYFARSMHRLAERRRPLMGRLMDRLPQELEKT